jgi:ribonuclease HI
VKLLWVPSHIGIDGNENADVTVRVAANSDGDITKILPISDAVNRN